MRHEEGEASMARSKRKRGAESSMAQLPSCIIVEILSRLPAACLLRCRCVCKTWRSLLSDDLFARTQITIASAPSAAVDAHLMKASASLAALNTQLTTLSASIAAINRASLSFGAINAHLRAASNTLAAIDTQLARASSSASMGRTNVIVKLRNRSAFYLFELESHHDYTLTPQRSMRFKTKLKLPGEDVEKLKVMGCCNGLLCLCEAVSGKVNNEIRVYVCNPILGEYGVLPQPKAKNPTPPSSLFGKTSEFYMFGFSPVTGLYKILRFLRIMSSKTTAQVEVFAIGRDRTWRNLAEAPCPCYDGSHQNHVTLNGKLHWLRPCSSSLEIINCFDIDTEQFQTFPHPPDLRRHDACRMRLALCGNCLCLFDHDMLDMDVWSMKEYGVGESWTRVYTVTVSYPNPDRDPIPSLILNYSFNPFIFWKDGELLISGRFRHHPLISYNPKDKSFRKQKIYGMRQGDVIPFDFAPSLLSPKHIAVPQCSKV